MRMKKKKKKKERKKMMISDFFGDLFLSSHVLKGTFVNIFVNCQTVSFSLHAGFGVCSFFGHYVGDT